MNVITAFNGFKLIVAGIEWAQGDGCDYLLGKVAVELCIRIEQHLARAIDGGELFRVGSAVGNVWNSVAMERVVGMMEKNRASKAEAYRIMQKRAMDKRKTLLQVANMISNVQQQTLFRDDNRQHAHIF